MILDKMEKTDLVAYIVNLIQIKTFLKTQPYIVTDTDSSTKPSYALNYPWLEKELNQALAELFKRDQLLAKSLGRQNELDTR